MTNLQNEGAVVVVIAW